MLKIIVPYLVFLFAGPIFAFFGLSTGMAYLVKTIIVLAILEYYWKKYKFKWKMSWFAVGTGIVIFLLWVGLEGSYPLMGDNTVFVPGSLLEIVFRVIGAVLAAPIVEELLTRSLLMRYMIDKNWEKVKHGTFTWPSFIITVLFFGLSHNRWLVGILSGILFNLVWYREKSIEPCITAHAVANLLLSVYVLYTGAYWFW